MALRVCVTSDHDCRMSGSGPREDLVLRGLTKVLTRLRFLFARGSCITKLAMPWVIMRGMQILWSGKDTYRAFFNRAVPSVCLISTTSADNARSVTVGNVLLVAVNAHQRFCDFELICAAPEAPIQLPDFSTAQVTTELVTVVEPNDRVLSDYNPEQQTIYIEIGGAPGTCTRYRLGESLVWLGVSERGNLRQILCSNLVNDPMGHQESRWLDEIGS